jgi:hypothetical protein
VLWSEEERKPCSWVWRVRVGRGFFSLLTDIKQNPLTLVKSLIKLLNSFQTKEERETIRQTFRPQPGSFYHSKHTVPEGGAEGG